MCFRSLIMSGAARPTVLGATALFLLLCSGPAAAHIRSTTGDVVPVPRPSSLAGGAFESNTEIRVLLERSNVILAADLPVDAAAAGAYGPPPGGATLAAGQIVSSYLIHVDPVGMTLINLDGIIEFGEEILGLVFLDATLATWDPVVSLGIPYPTGAYRGMDVSVTGSGLDTITFDGAREVKIEVEASTQVDQMRVLVAGASGGASFSIDYQGPSWNTPASFGGVLGDDCILTTGDGGAPGPNRPVYAPAFEPGVMLDRVSLGVTASGAHGGTEVDALSYGHDSGRRLRFSVDEFAAGMPVGVPPNLRSEGTAGRNEASADVFGLSGPFAYYPAGAPTLGNFLALDGNGDALAARPGFYLDEPNAAISGIPDLGDNLDALDLGTLTTDPAGPVYFSLDGDHLDSHEGELNTGSALANGFSGADILVVTPGSAPVEYAAATTLGLFDNVEGKDDINALMVWDDGDQVFESGVDKVYFSLRRDSPTVVWGIPCPVTGLPITESDILEPYAFGSPPRIVVPGEVLGLHTRRCGTQWDDVDAMDRLPGASAPVGNPDIGFLDPGALLEINVLDNDAALMGQLSPASVTIIDQPACGQILGIDPTTGTVTYRHDGGSEIEDSFTYIVYDERGEFTDVVEVTLMISSGSGVESQQTVSPISRFALAGPNPFANSTRFAVRLEHGGRTSINVYTVSGRLVRNLLAADLAPGERRIVTWDGRDRVGAPAAAGIYLVRMTSPGCVRQLRVTHLR